MKSCSVDHGNAPGVRAFYDGQAKPRKRNRIPRSRRRHNPWPALGLRKSRKIGRFWPIFQFGGVIDYHLLAGVPCFAGHVLIAVNRVPSRAGHAGKRGGCQDNRSVVRKAHLFGYFGAPFRTFSHLSTPCAKNLSIGPAKSWPEMRGESMILCGKCGERPGKPTLFGCVRRGEAITSPTL